MASALIGLGSNIEPERWLVFAAGRIRARFPRARFSAVYRSPAVGMDGPDFLNACAWLPEAPPLEALVAWLKAVEDEAGRDRTQGSWRPRTLDLDVLAYDGRPLGNDLARFLHAWQPARDVWPALPTPRPPGAIERVGLCLCSEGGGLQSAADRPRR